MFTSPVLQHQTFTVCYGFTYSRHSLTDCSEWINNTKRQSQQCIKRKITFFFLVNSLPPKNKQSSSCSSLTRCAQGCAPVKPELDPVCQSLLRYFDRTIEHLKCFRITNPKFQHVFYHILHIWRKYAMRLNSNLINVNVIKYYLDKRCFAVVHVIVWKTRALHCRPVSRRWP